MTRRHTSLILLLGILIGGACSADEPIIGGPCEGCEHVFVGLPDTLSWRARIAPGDEPGEALVIEGTVRTPDGNPAAAIIVYAYQTDANGIYPRGTTRHGSLRAWTRTQFRCHRATSWATCRLRGNRRCGLRVGRRRLARPKYRQAVQRHSSSPFETLACCRLATKPGNPRRQHLA